MSQDSENPRCPSSKVLDIKNPHSAGFLRYFTLIVFAFGMP
jgi:hypothetical protein